MTRPVETWNETPAANDFDIDEGGAPPSHMRTKVDDSNRQRMSALASFYQDSEWRDLLRDPLDRSISFPVARISATTIDITSGTNDLSALFNTGRRIKTTTAGSDTDEIEVLSVAYSNPTTTVTIYSGQGDTVTAGIDGLLLHAGASLRRFAFRDTLPSQYILLNGLTDADFAAAIAQVVTDGGGTILLPVGTVALTGQHSIPVNCRIIGQGIGISILDSSSNTNTSILDVANGFKVAFESFTLIGGPGAGAGTEHGILFHTAGAADARINDVLLKSIEGDAIRFEGGTQVRDVVISGCTIESPGGNGIYCDDDNTNVERCSISDCTLQAFGGQVAATSYGIRVAGQWQLSNISISGLDFAGPLQQVGLALWEKVAANPNEQDAHHCSVSGISVTGTGAEARGIDMNGRFCSVTGANINLTGASSTGVRVGGTLGSQLAQNNKLVASSITAAVGYDETNTAAKNNSVVGCSFQDCGIDVRLQASGGGLIADNGMSDATVGSIVVISGDKYFISGNRIHDNAGNGIDVQTGSTGCRVSHNEVINAAGSDYVNGAGSGAVFHHNAPYDSVVAHQTADITRTSNGTTDLTGLTALAFPSCDGGPDSVKKYEVVVNAHYRYRNWTASIHTLQLKIFMGVNGTSADTVQNRADLTDEAVVNGLSKYGTMNLRVEVAPASTDLIGVALVMTGSGSASDRATIYGDAAMISDALKTIVRIRRIEDA